MLLIFVFLIGNNFCNIKAAKLEEYEQELENIKEKLKQYEKVTKDFDDIEDREIYLVRRESLF